MASNKSNIGKEIRVGTVEAGATIGVYKEELSAPGNGAWIFIPAGAKAVVCTMSFPGGGSGKVQTTTDPVLDVKDDVAGITAADWVDGTVMVTTSNVCAPVTAIRQVNVSGNSKLTIRVQ